MSTRPSSCTWTRCVALTCLLLPGAALACSCMADEQGKFLHVSAATSTSSATISLPANARGVLFLPETYPDYVLRDEGRYSIVRQPVALSTKNFRIQERGVGRKLTPVVVRLRVEKQMGQQLQGYYLASPEMQQCTGQKNASLPICRSLNAATEDWSEPEPQRTGDKIKRFALQQGLRDISEEVDAAYGLYRIEAREGFKPGKQYDIEYHDGARRLKLALRMESLPLSLNQPAPFAIHPQGPPGREILPMASNDGSCGRRIKVATQPLRLALPPSYERHASLLLYFMQQKLQQADQQHMAAAGQFTPFHYWPALCTSIAYGGSFHGEGRELAIGDCQSPAPRQVKAFAGVLEVEDRLHETTLLPVSFPAAKPGQCPKVKDDANLRYFVPAMFR